MNQPTSRRKFLGAAVAPAVLTDRRSRSSSRDETVIGERDYQYQANHDWAQLPDKFTWQTTHNVAVDSAHNVYVIHDACFDKNGDIFVAEWVETGRITKLTRMS